MYQLQYTKDCKRHLRCEHQIEAGSHDKGQGDDLAGYFPWVCMGGVKLRVPWGLLGLSRIEDALAAASFESRLMFLDVMLSKLLK